MQYVIFLVMSSAPKLGDPVAIGISGSVKTLFKPFKLRRSHRVLTNTSRNKLQCLITWASLCMQLICWSLVGCSCEKRFLELICVFLALSCWNTEVLLLIKMNYSVIFHRQFLKATETLFSEVFVLPSRRCFITVRKAPCAVPNEASQTFKSHQQLPYWRGS